MFRRVRQVAAPGATLLSTTAGLFKTRRTNLSSSITPLWPGESGAFVGPVTEYADLILILPTIRKSWLTVTVGRKYTTKLG